MVHVQNQDIIMVQKVLCNSVYIYIKHNIVIVIVQILLGSSLYKKV